MAEEPPTVPAPGTTSGAFREVLRELWKCRFPDLTAAQQPSAKEGDETAADNALVEDPVDKAIHEASGDSESSPSRDPKSSTDSESSSEVMFTHDEILDYYWPDVSSTENVLVTRHSTLNASAACPDSLQFVLLFHGGNPAWSTNKIIYVKSQLQLLGLQPFHPEAEQTESDAQARARIDAEVPGDDNPLEHSKSSRRGEGFSRSKTTTKDSFKWIDLNAYLSKDDAKTASAEAVEETTESSTERDVDLDNKTTSEEPSSAAPAKSIEATIPTNPVAVFEQPTHPRGGMRFAGYFRVKRVDHLAPHSEELVHMLRQKWEAMPPQRNTPANFSYPRRQKVRDPRAWERSLGVPWAVVEFEAFDEVEGAQSLSPPDIAHLKSKKRAQQLRGQKGKLRRVKAMNFDLENLKIRNTEQEPEAELQKEGTEAEMQKEGTEAEIPMVYPKDAKEETTSFDDKAVWEM